MPPNELEGEGSRVQELHCGEKHATGAHSNVYNALE